MEQKKIKDIADLLGMSAENVSTRVFRLGVEYLHRTEPKIHAAKINNLLPENINVVCVIGKNIWQAAVLIIRIKEDDNDYVYRYLDDVIEEGALSYEKMISDIMILYNKKRISRYEFHEKASGGCMSCESCYDASPDESIVTHPLCVKDSQGVGVHPDFPCSLHKFKEATE